MKAFVLALALAGCATAADNLEPLPAASPAPVIAAEREFAARAGVTGWIQAFREYTAPDGQMVGRVGLVDAPQRLAQIPGNGGTDLFWQPAYAGIARSGDLGFTTGPASSGADRVPGIQYFTVWRKQADGSWKWIYDGGPGPVEAPGPYLAEGADIPTLAVASSGVGSATEAIAQVDAIEQRAATASGLMPLLASNAHVYRQGRARTFGGAASQANLTSPSGNVAYTLRRAEASAAGDMVFTLGEAHWTENGAAAQGFFARIWQRQGNDWRIVYDQLVPWSPPPAAN